MGRPQFGQSGRGTSTFLPAAAYSATLSRQAQAMAMPSSSFPLEPRIPAVSHHQAVALFFILKHRCRFLLGLPLSPQPALPKPLSPSSSSNARNTGTGRLNPPLPDPVIRLTQAFASSGPDGAQLLTDYVYGSGT